MPSATSPLIAPYGAWPSAISAAQVAAGATPLTQLAVGGAAGQPVDVMAVGAAHGQLG